MGGGGGGGGVGAAAPASAASTGASAASAGVVGAAAASTDEPACAICIADFVHGDSLRTLPCGHEFHVACIDEWLVLKPLCPTCRGLIDPGLEDVLAAPEDPYGLGQVDLRELALMLSHGGGLGGPVGPFGFPMTYYYSDDDDDGVYYHHDSDDEYY